MPLSELETAAALYSSARVQPAAMVVAIQQLVNAKFKATVLPPRIRSLELEADGDCTEALQDRLRQKIGIRAVTHSRPGVIQLSLDRSAFQSSVADP